MTSLKAILASNLYDETDFYQRFITDLLGSTQEVIIESPFITTERMKMLYLVFEKNWEYRCLFAKVIITES